MWITVGIVPLTTGTRKRKACFITYRKWVAKLSWNSVLRDRSLLTDLRSATQEQRRSIFSWQQHMLDKTISILSSRQHSDLTVVGSPSARFHYQKFADTYSVLVASKLLWRETEAKYKTPQLNRVSYLLSFIIRWFSFWLFIVTSSWGFHHFRRIFKTWIEENVGKM